jgi:oligopeptide/dipeptide ABC transporter ATP-binding protein
MFSNPLLRVENLKVYFPIKSGFFGKIIGYVKAVDGVSFSLKKGEIHALVGESGSGKTTIVKAILRLVDPIEGRIIFDEKDITKMREDELRWYRRRVQAVFQNPQTSLNPRMKVKDILAEPLKIHTDLTYKEILEKIRELIKLVGLPESVLEHSPPSLSGGQAQRVAIARAISINPELILLDEPTSALDVSTQAQILNLLLDLKEKLGLSYILVTHDISVAKYMADYISVIYLGKIVEQGPAAYVLNEPLHPYTRLLLSSVPELEKTITSFPKIIEREDIKEIKGCKFSPRCPLASDRCFREEPPLIEVKKEHFVSCWNLDI